MAGHDRGATILASNRRFAEGFWRTYGGHGASTGCDTAAGGPPKYVTTQPADHRKIAKLESFS